MRRGAIFSVGILLMAGPACSELFVADFNNDGKPDVLMSSAASPEGFVVLLNQGEIDGKVTFRKVSPDVKSVPAYVALPTYPSAATAPNPNSAWQQPAPAPSQPQAAAAKPAILPPPAPSISSGTPKLKVIGAPAARPTAPAAAPESEWKPSTPAAPTPKGWTPGGRNVALFNYKDKTAGSQFAWLERGIANILKFDVIEVKSVQMVDRERTDVTFDPAWVRDAQLAADVYITGEFEEAAERLIVTTWFLSPSMSSMREFKIEGDRADIFSLIEKVGTRLKQELSSL